MHLGCLLPGRSPRIATTFQPSWATLGSMGIRPDDSKTALRALLRRHALLAAYLDAVNQIDGPNHRRRAAELRLVHRPRRDLSRVPCGAISAKGPKSSGGGIANRAARQRAVRCQAARGSSNLQPGVFSIDCDALNARAPGCFRISASARHRKSWIESKVFPIQVAPSFTPQSSARQRKMPCR